MTDTRTIIKNAEGTEEDKMFEGALNSILHMDKKDYPSYVGGMMVASGHEFIVSSPIDTSIIFGHFQDSEDGIADIAVKAALDAFKEWSSLDIEKRAGIFEMLLDNVERQRYRLAAAVSISSGMTRERSVREITELIAIMRRETEKARSGVKTKPTGVWAIVSEHNSPLASPIAYAVAAMLAGNTVIMLPSRYTPVPVYMIYDLLKAAMLPAGVMNVIVDRKGKITKDVLDMDDVSGIVAIGSGERMEEMMFLQTDDELRFVNEIKGMNPVLVNRPSNMVNVAKSLLKNAFSYSGQDINACSKVVVMADDQKAFMDAVLKEAQSIVIGDPADMGKDLGPVISEKNMKEFLDIADNVRDSTIFGGKKVVNEETAAGYFVRPLIVMGLPMDHELNNIDHGLPILSIQVAGDIEEAMEMINGCEFGSFSGIYTKDDNISKQFIKDAVADHVYVNDPDSILNIGFNAEMKNFSK